MDSDRIILFNAILYSITTLVYWRISKGINIGLYILGLFTIGAWSSVLFYFHPLFQTTIHASEMTIEPFLYLYIVLLIFLFPLLNFDSSKIFSIKVVGESKILILLWSFLLIQLIIMAAYTPAVLSGLSGDLGANRAEVYDGSSEVLAQVSQNRLIRVLTRLFYGLRNISFVISLYAFLFLKRKYKFLVTISLIVSFCYPIYISLASTGRQAIVTQLVFAGFLYILFRNLISDNIKRRLSFAVLLVMFPLGFVIYIISFSRFGDMASLFFYKYAGEGFINFNGLMYHNLAGTTNGQAYFPVFNKLLNPDARVFITAIEKWQFIESQTGVMGNIFYTFIGALCFEFGKVGTAIVSILFSLMLSKVIRYRSIVSLPDLVLISSVGYMFLTGVFYFIWQGENGNYEIIFTILVYLWLRYKIE